MFALFERTRDAIQTYPDDPDARYLQTLAMARLGDPDAALRFYERNRVEEIETEDAVALKGRLFKDLAACNAYADGLAAATEVRAPATLVLGERDLMTPAAGGMKLAAALSKARVVTLEGAGHMLLSERPDEVLAAIRDFAA